MKLAPLVAAIGLSLTTTAAIAECEQPTRPILPDGAASTMEQMLDGQKAVKTFQTANLEYMDCLNEMAKSNEAAAKKADGDDKDAATAEYDKAITLHNAAVTAEEEVAGQFNTEIREYKAANPG